MSCVIRTALCLRRGQTKPKGFNWTLQFARRWEANKGYAAGVRVRPNERPQTGFDYESSGGQSNGKAEPKWPDPLDTVADVTTVKEGSITWTARAMSFASLLERISSVNWPAVAGYTITPGATVDEPGNQHSPAQIAAGATAVDGEIICEVTTTDGNEYHAIYNVTIDNAS